MRGLAVIAPQEDDVVQPVSYTHLKLPTSELMKDEEEAQEFRSFIQSIKPSDFEKLLKHDKESDQ